MLDRDDADYYATKLVRHDLAVSDLPELNQSVLREVGIHRMGHVIAILKYAKELARARDNTGSTSDSSGSRSRTRSRSPIQQRSKRQAPVRSSRREAPTKRHSIPSSRTRHSPVRTRRASERSSRRRPRSASSSSESSQSSSSSSAKSPSPPRRSRQEPERSKRAQVNGHDRSERTRKSSGNVAHIDRTSAKKVVDKPKLDDDTLLTAQIELPARFKSKNKQPSVLKKAISTGGPRVKRQFIENDDIARQLGLGVKNTKSEENSRDSSKFIYVKKHTQRSLDTDSGPLRVGVKGGGVEKFKRAERPTERRETVFARLNISKGGEKEPRAGIESRMRSDSIKSADPVIMKNVVRSDAKPLKPTPPVQVESKKRKSVDAPLAKVTHKLSRHGKSHSMFGNDEVSKAAAKNINQIATINRNAALKSGNKKESSSSNVKSRLGKESVKERLG